MTISLENEVSFSSKIEYAHFNEVNDAMISYGTEKPLAYRPRLVDERLQRLLTTFGAVEIRGTKWCGKSWAALAFGESVIHLDDPNVKTLAAADPTLALQGAPPRHRRVARSSLHMGRCSTSNRYSRRARAVHPHGFVHPCQRRSYTQRCGPHRAR